MGQQQLWKRINSKEFMHNKVFNRDLDKLRQYINSGADEAEVAKHRNKLDVYEKLKKMINQAKEKAERQIANDDRYKHIDILGLGNQKVKNLMDSNDFGYIFSEKHTISSNRIWIFTIPCMAFRRAR